LFILALLAAGVVELSMPAPVTEEADRPAQTGAAATEQAVRERLYGSRSSSIMRLPRASTAVRA
jgi:hypothetical protein